MRYVLDFHHAFSPTCCHSCCHHTCHQATLSAAGSPPPASCPLASPRSSSEMPSVAEHGLTPRFSPRGELGYRGSRWLGPHLGVDGLLVTREGETCITLYHYTIDIYIYIYIYLFIYLFNDTVVVIIPHGSCVFAVTESFHRIVG